MTFDVTDAVVPFSLLNVRVSNLDFGTGSREGKIVTGIRRKVDEDVAEGVKLWYQ